ncbi:MAG: AAA family ATPase [Gammaproteobacteria bacterium]|nr:AAA family ATPase [Gammaproteobacteria bacterium]MCY4340670.1 AAA family ATPase [Gammaproteobacteria bacterium]
MRLKRIRLAGFKSFPDPVNIEIPESALAIVGPNGCGKSNIIDAVRWVLGEISARQLRSGAMAEVIFNGSSRRTALGAATVELLFDNTEPGPRSRFAEYSEITVRRAVRRDGISEYFLNNSRCRRKDITQLFAGTGLGIGGYAIIEQSTINLLVEGSTDELRAYLEEAAGVSGYRQRRRETTLRIARTRGNLEKLAERRAELDSNLRRLRRQASAAGRYRKNMEEKRRLAAQRLALDIRSLNRLLDEGQAGARARETELARVEAEYRSLETRIAQARERQSAAQADFDEANQAFYALSAEIAGLEETLQTQQELGRERDAELARLGPRLEDLREELRLETAERGKREQLLGELGPELAAAREKEQAARTQSERAVDRQSRWQADQHAAEMQLQSLAQRRELLLRERLAGLESLQDAARRRSGQQAVDWLERRGLAEQPRLSQHLKVSRRWRVAVELVLGDFIEATRVEGIEGLSEEGEWAPGVLLVEEGGAEPVAGTLLAEVRGAGAMSERLAGVRTAAGVSEAVAMLDGLRESESVMTPQGVWMGRGWLRVAGRGGEGALEREVEIAALKEALADPEGHAAPALQDLSDDSDRSRVQARLEQLEGEIGRAASQQQAVAGRKPDAKQDIQALRALTAEAREAARGLERRQAELEPQLHAAARACERIAADIAGTQDRMERLDALNRQSSEALASARGNLNAALKRKPEVDKALNESRRAREEADSALAAAESGRASIQAQLNAEREKLNETRVERRELEVRRNGLGEQLSRTGHKLEEILEALPRDASAEELEAQLEKVERRIERIGPVNLAAEKELGELKERKDYLDSQHQDLTGALETLENTMRRLDRETRSRLEETGEAVSKGFDLNFARLFGGGRAGLAFEGDDVLTADIRFMVHPPGKRNVRVSQLSGGEKSLAAIAFLVAVVQLNPAPFCMLDEVDAALDDVNVAKFCELLAELSSALQCLVVTHNKSTMQAADYLLGVTMEEPGISRIVTVDLDEAVRLAAA